MNFFILSHKSEKRVIERNNIAFEAYLLTEEPGSLFLLIELLKITCARSNASRSNILLKLIKITMTFP